MLKSLDKGQNTKLWWRSVSDLLLQWHFFSWYEQQFNMAKCKVIMSSKTQENGQVLLFKLDRYSIISTWCAHHGVYHVLKRGKSFKPKWAKTSFSAQGSDVKVFFRISWFDWIQLMILDKMRSCLWKLKLVFRTFGLLRILSPRVLRFNNFKSNDFGENKQLLFVKTRAGVLDL